MPKTEANKQVVKTKLHRRNKHKNRYNFKKLIELSPELANYVAINKYGVETIDFFSPTAVKILNASLLKFDYGIENWDIPKGYLCPPIPGRADYIHYAADLLGSDDNKHIPTGKKIKCLDIGIGANCIYPIIGVAEYDWNFVGAEIDDRASKAAKNIVNANPLLKGKIAVRTQVEPEAIFDGIINEGEKFDLTVSNPPFHSSAEEAANANLRKIKNLKGKQETKGLNSFGGKNNELWCKGGELRFIRNMVKQSKNYADQVLWFTTLVSKQGNLKNIYLELKKADALEVKTIAMGQGNKASRIIAWTFLNPNRRKQWVRERE